MHSCIYLCIYRLCLCVCITNYIGDVDRTWICSKVNAFEPNRTFNILGGCYALDANNN